ncbi:MAG: alkaline phosphatase family protein [Bacteroides sp.]|nr:alkaline phosphatase family protein [Bacteroides sp.]
MAKNKSQIISAPALALIATLLTALPVRVSAAVDASVPQRPQLVLSIMVDGLRNDYLELLAGHFGPDGFNRLLRDGVTIEDVEFGPGVDAAGAVCMLYTGASPSVSGLATADVFSTERKILQSALLDPSKIGNYTDETLSPAALKVSTLSDEIRIDGGGAAYAHSIAPDASRAIIMSGHAGNSAFWINSANGQWATTTHYRDVPTPVSARNYTRPLSGRIDTVLWAPSLPVDQYPALPAHKRHYPFRHTFSGFGPDKYKVFKTAAPVNAEVTDLAIDYLRDLKLGQRDAMDMLSVGYTLAPYAESTDIDARLETMDAYLKLDRQIARLLKAANGETTLVILGGTPAEPAKEPDDPQWGLPGGEFSAKKALSLLNMYLIAKLGNGEWVTAYNNGAFYLNHKLIGEKKLDPEEVRTEAAKFLTKMSGVADAFTIDDILEGRSSDALRRNTVMANAADVYVKVIPGWTLSDDTVNPAQKHVVRYAHSTAPVILYAPAILESARISTPIDSRRIAPTVARILRIRSPNGASEPPLNLKRK